MAPPRAKQEPASVAGSSRRQIYKKPRNHPYSRKPRFTHEDTLPGVQKLKSALRQTKRLLSKGDLAADVRVGTERRLKALEVDLARAEASRKERQHATKYHKVKFFERQKVVRKIKQTKRRIVTSETKEEAEKLKSTLADLRVDLNYILHFPKTQKYVSLFRLSGPSGSTAASVVAASDGNEERSRVREIICRQMQRGELSTEPENELGGLGREKKPSISGRRVADVPPSIKARAHTDDAASDDFFGEDDDDDSEQSGTSDS